MNMVFISTEEGWKRFQAAAPIGPVQVLPLGWRLAGLPDEETGRRRLKGWLWPQAEAVSAKAWELSQGWYKDGAADITRYGGVSLGDAFYMPLWFSIFLPAVKWFALARAAIAAEGPAAVWCDARAPYFLRQSLRALSRKAATPFSLHWLGEPSKEFLPFAEALAPLCEWSPYTPGPWRDAVLPRLYNALGAPLRWWRGWAGSGRPLAAAAYYPNLKFLFDRLASREGARRLGCDLLEWPPRALALAFLKHGARLVGRTLGAPSAAQRGAARAILDAWRRARTVRAAAFPWEGVALGPLVESALDRYLEENLPAAVARVDNFRRVFRRGYKAVLLPFDSTPEYRTCVDVARQAGVPSVMVVHGVGFFGKVFGDGPRADYTAMDGPALAERFIEAGRAKESLWIGCGGLFDRHGARRPAPPYSLRRKILLLTNPPLLALPYFFPGESEDYLVQALTALARLDVRVTVRRHPVESASYYASVLARVPGRAVMAGEVSFSSLLAEHGVVLGPVSTAMVEAMAESRWVAGLNWEGYPYPAPFDGSAFPVFRKPDALTDWLTGVLADGAAAPDHAPTLRRYAGQLDGRQADRLLERVAALPATPKVAA